MRSFFDHLDEVNCRVPAERSLSTLTRKNEVPYAKTRENAAKSNPRVLKAFLGTAAVFAFNPFVSTGTSRREERRPFS